MVDITIDVLSIADFLTADESSRIVDEMRAVEAAAAEVLGGAKAIDPSMRQVLSAEVSDATAELVVDRMREIVPRLEEHFGVKLSEIEEPSFLHYRVGDFFVAHQDGNTPLIHDATLARKVSVIVFLNDQDVGYEGGSLMMHGAWPDWEYRQDATASAGSLLAFRSETTHEVQPVVGGERFTIVSWLRSEDI